MWRAIKAWFMERKVLCTKCGKELAPGVRCDCKMTAPTMRPHDKRFLEQLQAEVDKEKKAYDVSTEEARMALECVNRLANWKGEVGHA